MRSDHFFKAELKASTPGGYPIKASSARAYPRDLFTHWVPPGMRVQVHHRSLPDGLVYFCDDAQQRGIVRAEPSLIDESPCWINEAAFDAFDEALLESEDPIEFNGSPLADLRT